MKLTPLYSFLFQQELTTRTTNSYTLVLMAKIQLLTSFELVLHFFSNRVKICCHIIDIFLFEDSEKGVQLILTSYYQHELKVRVDFPSKVQEDSHYHYNHPRNELSITLIVCVNYLKTWTLL